MADTIHKSLRSGYIHQSCSHAKLEKQPRKFEIGLCFYMVAITVGAIAVAFSDATGALGPSAPEPVPVSAHSGDGRTIAGER